jgi:hypothetical protein
VDNLHHPSAGKTAANISGAENEPTEDEVVKAAKILKTKNKFCFKNN